jgi:hypothetical protein
MIDKILAVAQNDTGALRVLTELHYFPDFENMLEWLYHSKYKGPELWILYNDHFNKDIVKVANFIRESA